MSFTTLPAWVIERIVIFSTNTPQESVHPPTTVISIASSCRHIYTIVFGNRNTKYTIFARIARYRYPTAAALRRLGPAAITDRHLAMELAIRVSTLRRVRRGDPYSPHLEADLWVVYYMCIEDDDGRNIEQLVHADAVLWVSRIIASIPRDFDEGPFERIEPHLAIAIYALFSLHYPSIILRCDSEADANDVRRAIHYFTFATDKHQISCLMTHMDSPRPVPNPLWGHIVHMGIPPIAVSAALCFLAIWTDANGTNRHIFRYMSLTSHFFDADFWRLIFSYIPVVSADKCESIFARSPNGSQPSQSPTHPAASVEMSRPVDTLRLSRCWYGEGRLWAPGMLTGMWTGEDGVKGTRSLDWYFDPFYEIFPKTTLTLREHVRTVIRQHVSPTLTWRTTYQDPWIDTVVKEAENFKIVEGEVPYRLSTRDPKMPFSQPIEYFTVTHISDTLAPKHNPHNTDYEGYGVATLIPPPEPVPAFRPAVNMALVGSDESDEEDGLYSNSSDGIEVDVVLTGELLRGDRWYQLFGRIRECDGLIVLVVIPSVSTPQSDSESSDPSENLDNLTSSSTASETPSRFFYGYLVCDSMLVGRWNDTLNSESFEERLVFKRGL